MKIINLEISNYNITYTVETKKGNVFTHALSKDVTTYNVQRYLNLLCNNIDKSKYSAKIARDFN